MSSSDRAERILHLRRVVAGVGQAPARPRLAIARALDRRLGGGLAQDALHEIVPAAPADATAAFGFALSLAARFMAARNLGGLLVIEEFAFSQNGVPFGPGLASYGLDLSRLVFVRAPDASALFQTVEDALRSASLAVVIGEVWRLAKYDLAVSRRLTLAARAGATPVLLTLPSAQALSTAAETRFEIAAAPSAHVASAAERRPLPGPPAFAARLVKARNGTGADGERTFRLQWRSEEQGFDEPAISVPVAAAPADRSRPARA